MMSLNRMTYYDYKLHNYLFTNRMSLLHYLMFALKDPSDIYYDAAKRNQMLMSGCLDSGLL